MSRKLKLALLKQIKPILGYDYESLNIDTVRMLMDSKPLRETLIEFHKKSALFGFKRLKKDLYDDLLEQQMLSYATDIAGQKLTWLTAETENLILGIVRDSITQGQAQGWGRDKIARYLRNQLSEQYGTISRYRSVMIAQTEINASVNYGSLRGAMEAGVTMKKKWIQGGFDSREAHQAANGQQVNLDETFLVGGERLMYPGDSSLGASAGNVINCRCRMVYERVNIM